MAIVLPDGTPVGVATWLRLDHGMGTAKVGNITYSAAPQRTTAAIEVMWLMAAPAFDVVGVRRYEWKCDSLDSPSRRATARLGFAFEGVFRKAVHYKDCSRDTGWLAMSDDEWPRVRAEFQRRLDPADFDERGHQLSALQARSTTPEAPR